MRMEATRTSPAAPATSPYPPIEDYAVIGDCRTAALISSSGSIDWMCLPHFSADAVFAAILDRQRGGCFAVHPVEPFTSVRRYVGATPVLETTFRTSRGTACLTDLMPVLVDGREEAILNPEREVLRVVEVIDGEMEIEVHFAPRPRYGRTTPRLMKRGALGWACASRELYHLHADVPLQPVANDSELRGRVRLQKGEKRYLSLCFVRGDIGVIAPLGADADLRLRETLGWWREWSSHCTYDGPYREMVLRSAITMKLMTYQLSGAVVAAPTTSLPEWIGGTRNWDYRYCWLRDASLTLSSFMDLGFRTEGDAFLGWLLHATALSRNRLQVLYDVYGETDIPERVLDHLEGYRGSQPVRAGNGAAGQLQLDAYGNVVLAAFDFVERFGSLSRSECRFLRGLGEAVCDLWRRPDHGIWEIRGAAQHHTYSKFMCWVALDRLLRLHDMNKVRVPVVRFRRERAAIAHEIETRGYNEEIGGYSAFFDAPIPDASLLLMAHFGYRPADDPRMRATFECIERELTDGDLVYRYPLGIDNFPCPEGAFVITSFWNVDYLARRGDLDAAHARFERLLDYANDVGLYSEEIDPKSGVALGNFPQAFSHVGLVDAALSLADAGRRRRAQ